MAHFARVSNGNVVGVYRVENAVLEVDGVEVESLGQAFLADLLGGDPSDYVQASYTGSPVAGADRGPYPGPGYAWDGTAFIAPPDPAA